MGVSFLVVSVAPAAAAWSRLHRTFPFILVLKSVALVVGATAGWAATLLLGPPSILFQIRQMSRAAFGLPFLLLRAAAGPLVALGGDSIVAVAAL